MTVRWLTLLVALTVPATASAQGEWNENKGDCDSVLKARQPEKVAKIRSCTELWETYRDISGISPMEKRAVARNFSALYYKGGSGDKDLASGALSRIGMTRVPADDLGISAGGAKKAKARKAAKYYPEVSRSRQKEADKLIKKGLKLHKKKTKKAIGFYEKAMRADPNNLKANFNAACAYALLGDASSSLELLQDIKDRQSRAGRRLLQAARKDKDFRRIRNRNDFKRVTGYAEIVLLNGAGAEGKQFTAQLKRRLTENGHKPAFVGNDEASRGRPMVWYKQGLEDLAEEIKEIVDPQRTSLKKISFNTKIDKYDFDLYVIFGMPHRAALDELPEVGKRQGDNTGEGEGEGVDPFKAVQDAKGTVEKAGDLVKPPELPEF